MHITNMTQPNGESSQNSNLYMRLQQSQNMRANIQNISQLLNTGLSPEALDICVKLLETGVHPQALAEVVTQIRREMAALETDTQ
ncbi:mitotic-spindle organizing protein 1-like [Ochlerotatus camptorhynchus]|uniref:mitotic-spindle organizing protein 1-like n=1 Tax=Ochlerotatus camptorhynchus TaxID=644619 RepID=UPI0031D8F1DC